MSTQRPISFPEPSLPLSSWERDCAKTCAVHFMRNDACTQVPFALFLSIEETESKPFTSKFLLWFQNQLAKIKRQEQYKTLTYKDDKLQQHIYRKT